MEGPITEGCEKGVDVAIWDIAIGKARAKERELSRLGIRCMAIECDVTDSGAVFASTQRTVEEFGTVDILINGVGASRKAVWVKNYIRQWNYPKSGLFLIRYKV